MIESPQELGPEEKIEEETEVVPASYTSHSLVFLDKYTLYKIQILAFNPAGDGPRSVPVTVRTMQVRYHPTFLYLLCFRVETCLIISKTLLGFAWTSEEYPFLRNHHDQFDRVVGSTEETERRANRLYCHVRNGRTE